MRTEENLRLALRGLEREAPDAETVLRHVLERASARASGRARRPGRRVLAGAAAAAAVIAVALVAVLVTGPPASHGRAAAQDALQSVPRYYMALVGTGSADEAYAVVKDRITGQTMATVRPPKPYITFIGVTGAADDRTFVLTAQSTIAGSLTQRDKFFSARFNPADDAVTLAPLPLTGLPVSDSFLTAALSPDGTKLAVATWNGPTQITVYSLPSGAARTWSANVNSAMASPWGPGVVDVLSWSRTGILAFGWNGGYPRSVVRNGRVKPEGRYSPPGAYLLNTNTRGGSLMADSRAALCLAQSAPWTLEIGGFYGYLTLDGTKIIAPVARPIPVGRGLPSCSDTPHSGGAGVMPPLPATAAFEEFSATTGQAVSVIHPRHAVDAEGQVNWSSPSGSVLVVVGQLKPGPKSPWVFGILAGSRFIFLPGSLSARLTLELAF
jgi:hypothetical protein